MTKIIAITNQKGGVGKTTTSINLSAALAAKGQRVLLIDMDAQGNATMGSGVDKNKLEQGIAEVLVGDCLSLEALVPSTSGYDLLGSNSGLTAAEVALLKMDRREQRLKEALKTIADRYDYIIIDCPPSLNMLTLNSLVAATAVLVPMQCEYYALEGLSSLMETVDQLRANVNPDLYLEGLVRTMYDGRSRLTEDVALQLKAHFGNKLYNTIIPRNVRLAEAPSYGMSALTYDKKSQGAMAYLSLAEELMSRQA